MIIAIDYDGTLKCSYAHDQRECDMWAEVVNAFRAAGHTVIICTNRTGSVADIQDIDRYLDMINCVGMPVIFAGCRGYKSDVCREDGYVVDLWIDDLPEMIRQPYILRRYNSP